jgi:hypothetical protein
VYTSVVSSFFSSSARLVSSDAWREAISDDCRIWQLEVLKFSVGRARLGEFAGVDGLEEESERESQQARNLITGGVG